MRVLLINSVCGIRSTGRITSEIADNYIANGDECYIAYGREKLPKEYENISYKIGGNLSVRINGVLARLFDNDGFGLKKSTENFIAWANNYNPDVLWLHNLHGYYINVEVLFDWIKSRPNMEVYWTLHDCWPFTGHCAHFTYVKCNKWKSECKKCDQKKEYPKSLIFDASKKNYYRKKNCFLGVKNMTLITPSNWLATLLKDSFLKDYPVKVVNNKIDETIFKPTQSLFRENNNLTGKKIVLGVASSWNQKKGLSDFIQLSEMLDTSYKVVLVGLTKKQIKKIPKNILCISKTDSAKQLAEIYTAADIFVNLTYEDTYPTVNLESIACGTICITYNTGGSIESVDPKNVIQQGDLCGIVRRIKEIIN